MADILGPDYSVETMNLASGDVATLVSLPASKPGAARGAILYVHGFVDSFFHDHMARHFTERGWNWYALDLRRCGRSIRPGQIPWYTDDLKEYYEEIDLSIARIQADGNAQIVLMGHSTGGLVSAIWANDRRDTHPIDALVLNSPWLDLQESWFNRTIGTWAIRAIGAVRPLMNVPRPLTDIYPRSLHVDAEGEWEFDPALKPLTAQDVKMGFLASVRREQARLHKGMNVDAPVVMLRSSASTLGLGEWHDNARRTDTVLDVEQMKQWLPQLGKDVTDVPLAGAVHDVMLSAEPVRTQALAEIDAWLDKKLP